MAQAQPNFLIIMTDQERYPPCYEDEKMQEFRRTQLRGREAIRKDGFVFHQHYTASSACCPSRASFFTGQYPSLHGVSQTYGFAKNHDDNQLFWLEKGVVPTLGAVFRAAGYDTEYKGKWHISYENIIGARGEIVMEEEEYEKKNALNDYGFSGWVGPEPHGFEQQLTGAVRDVVYTKQVCQWLRDRKKEEKKPFVLVASLVNPHDIALTGPLYDTYPFQQNDDTVPAIPDPPTRFETLKSKPRVQELYRETYYRSITPEQFLKHSPTMYYFLHKRVDHCIETIYHTLKNETDFFNNTIVILTSDHGELLSAHGGMQAKWHNAYQEVVHLPLAIASPLLVAPGTGPVNVSNHHLTSHVDILPTMMDLAGLNRDEIFAKLRQTHTEVHNHVGRSLKSLLKNRGNEEEDEGNAVYISIEDEITRGQDQFFALSKLYPFLKKLPEMRRDPIYGVAVHLECVLSYRKKDKKLYKFVRYFDNKQRWSHPNVEDVLSLHESVDLGPRRIVRKVAYPDEFELYDLTSDPTEINNLYTNKAAAEVLEFMRGVLKSEREKKRKERVLVLPQDHSHMPHHAERTPGMYFLSYVIWLQTKPMIIRLLLLLFLYLAYKFAFIGNLKSRNSNSHHGK